MKLETLVKQRQALDEKIKAAELAERNKIRVEKMIARIAGKYEILLAADPIATEKLIDSALATVAQELTGGN